MPTSTKALKVVVPLPLWDDVMGTGAVRGGLCGSALVPMVQPVDLWSSDDLDHLLVEYGVPLRDSSTRTLRAINWPKGFYVEDLAPPGLESGREKLRSASVVSTSRSGGPRVAGRSWFAEFERRGSESPRSLS